MPRRCRLVSGAVSVYLHLEIRILDYSNQIPKWIFHYSYTNSFSYILNTSVLFGSKLNQPPHLLFRI